MTARIARILLVADTHLGLDFPIHPRVVRRRRGHDFLANFETALRPALEGKVDAVIHGGDLFDRSRVPASLVELALAPLVRVAQAGVPVYLVPGNHERARIPLHLWAAHPNFHLFHQPTTFLCPTPGGTLALSGFPFTRRVRDAFCDLVRQTAYQKVCADARILCLHQAVEGAQVGPSDYTFRSGPDVIRGRDLASLFGSDHSRIEAPASAGSPPLPSRPLSEPAFCVVLSGHIHRAQTLTHDLRGRPFGMPVVYPGSVERTSFAESGETKGYAIVTIGLDGQERNRLLDVAFVPLPARRMATLNLEPENGDPGAVLQMVSRRLAALDPDAVVRIKMHGPHAEAARRALSATALRGLAPTTMNISLVPESYRRKAD